MIYEMNALLPVVIVLAVLIVVLVIIIAIQQKNIVKNSKGIVVKDNVRYDSTESEEKAINFTEGDTVLKQGKKYVFSKKGPLLPGKYRMVSASETVQSFSVRTQGFVREYNNNDEMVFDEMDEITPISSNIILK